METTGQATIEVDAPIETVFELIADIERMGEWSPECYRTEWHDPHRTVARGATFQGYNRSGFTWWDVPCEILAVEPPMRLEFAAPAGHAAATVWTYDLQAGDGTTIVTERFDAPMLVMPETPAGQIPDRRTALVAAAHTTLGRIKRAAESAQVDRDG